MLVVVYSS